MIHPLTVTSLIWAISAALVLLAPVAALAQGGPPLITDDPGTPGNEKWEINLAYTMQRSRLATQYETPLLDMNYGLGDHSQLEYEVPLLLLNESGSELKSGLGDSLLGFKHRFLDEKQNGISASFYPQLFLNSSASSVHEKLVESGTRLFLPVQISRTFGKFELGAEVGYEFIQHRRDQWQIGVAAGYPVTDKLELLAEIHDEIDQDFRRPGELVFNFGTRWNFSEHIGLLFSIGRSFYDRRDSEQLMLYSGLRFTF